MIYVILALMLLLNGCSWVGDIERDDDFALHAKQHHSLNTLKSDKL